MKNLKLLDQFGSPLTSSSRKLSGGVIEGASPLIEMLMPGVPNSSNSNSYLRNFSQL